MSELMLVRHCSPTLAGMKTGNMFSCTYENAQEMRTAIRRFNKTLAKKGLRVVPLKFKDNRALIYVYRPEYLKRDLGNEIACELLRSRGYDCDKPQKCIIHLMDKLRGTEEFPHEIGLFLGYPPEDVHGFINDPSACRCSGCWKVYTNENEARKTFAKYKKCTKIYCRQWADGKPIERLVVAV